MGMILSLIAVTVDFSFSIFMLSLVNIISSCWFALWVLLLFALALAFLQMLTFAFCVREYLSRAGLFVGVGA